MAHGPTPTTFPSSSLLPVQTTYRHPKYNARSMVNDISILKLDARYENPRLAVLPTDADAYVTGDPVVVAGWGAQSPTSPYKYATRLM